MKLFAIRSAAVATLLSLLTACGGSGFDAATPVADGAAPAPAVMPAPATGVAVAPAAGADLAAMEPPPSNEQVPTPDCQPENCEGLRIIDGNAEAFRFDAMSRSGAAGGSSA